MKVWTLIWNEREEAEDATVDLFTERVGALVHLARHCELSDCYIDAWNEEGWSMSDVVHHPSGETIAVVELLEMEVK